MSCGMEIKRHEKGNGNEIQEVSWNELFFSE